ncbi:MAG: amidohydrolase family protein [Acidobacteriota bacterium]
MTEYLDLIHRGLPIDDVEIIDLHAHLGPYFNMHIPAADAAAMIRLMDRCGVDKAVISTTLSWDADFVLGNTMMLEAIARYPGRLYGACAVNGNYPELSLEELERTFAHKAVVMAKIHPSNTKCRLDDRRMRGIFEFAAKRKLLLLVHTWLNNDSYGNLDLFAEVARGHPDINWIMGHSGGPYGSVRAAELAREIKNIFLDITLSMCPAGQIEYFVREVGSRRVLFGTDNPFIDPRPQVGRVGLARISEEDKINIFGANARRLVALD